MPKLTERKIVESGERLGVENMSGKIKSRLQRFAPKITDMDCVGRRAKLLD